MESSSTYLDSAIGLVGTIIFLKGTSNLASNVNLDLALKGTNYILSFYYANAGVNSVLTLLIGMCLAMPLTINNHFGPIKAGRIWWMARQNRLELGSQNQFLNNEYKAIISILYVLRCLLKKRSLFKSRDPLAWNLEFFIQYPSLLMSWLKEIPTRFPCLLI
jgi:hypothetical protein